MIRRPDRSRPAALRPARTEARTPAILQAALAVLIDVGYERLTMEAVAAKAKAGKATLYRRWKDKSELIAEAVTKLRADCLPPPPDSGSLCADLAAVAAMITARKSRQELCVMQGLATAVPHDPALAALFQRSFLDRRSADMAELFRRAQRRGEIPPHRDVEFLGQLIPSMVFARTLATSRPVDPVWLDKLINDVVLPAATAGSLPDTEQLVTGPDPAATKKENHARRP
ncbi:MAG: TetR/AcrR family transcriptional regulator [Geodermatophilaceae bacterium]|nr:TetR/AcrR family transcriptional regulator [Geodermatophilaceae bacterium]MDQ3454735.1 TetR/AcrR family transcriptional regulator [Actinomycetota bacterium]